MDTRSLAFWKRLRKLPWWRFAAGMVSGVAYLVVTFILRVLGLGVFLPEQALSLIVTHIPGSVESAFIRALGEGAKALGFATAVLAVLVAFGLGALPFRRIQAWFSRSWAVVLTYALSTAAIVLGVVFPLLGAGLAGNATEAGVAFATFSQFLGAWLYAAVLEHILVDVAARHPEGFNPSRRQLLVGGVAAIGAFALAVWGLSATVVGPARLAFASVADMFSRERTPTGDFYVVTKNVIDPTVAAADWSLGIDGLVNTPATYSVVQLQALAADPAHHAEQFTTLECVSNEVGGNLIGTAKWAGVRLADLLSTAGVQSAASWVEFTCVDGYTVAIPLALAMLPTTLVVLSMNDAPLEDRHGFPARILVPGKYGMFSAKWVNRITVAPAEVLGFWQAKGWTNAGYDKTTAIIATPAPESLVAGSATLGGIAYAGARGISKVEVSTDGGLTWSAAVLRSPLDPAMTWVLWTYAWTPAHGGAYRIQARASAADGSPQDPTAAPPFPDGASGYDAITLYASG